MKSVNLKTAYQIQKKFTKNNNVTAYKVGASNHRSAKFFNYDEIILGGLDDSCIYFERIPKNYQVAEVEIVIKILISECNNNYKILGNYVGIECPQIMVDNPGGSAIVCVADNCSAGDLIIFQEVSETRFDSIKVFRNGEFLVHGSKNNLKFEINEIIEKTLLIIKEYELPLSSREFYIATGGITDVFSLSAGDLVEILYE